MNNNQSTRSTKTGLAGIPFILASRHPVRLLAYVLCIGILIPSLSFAAYLLSGMQARELSLLHQSAQSRAFLAASFFDEQIASLLRTLKEVPGTPATATENVRKQLLSELNKNGILLFARSANLDLLSPATGMDAALVNLDSPARTAAQTAFSTLLPQTNPYAIGDKKGVNIWIASVGKDGTPFVLQARIPASYLASAFKNFVSDGPWSISVVGTDGSPYAELNGKPLTVTDTEADGKASIVQEFAGTSQFGWKIGAGTPSQSIEQRARQNWTLFLAISSLLSVVSFTGATLLTRSFLNDANLGNLAPARGESSIGSRTETTTPAIANKMDAGQIREALQNAKMAVWAWNLDTADVAIQSDADGTFLPPTYGEHPNARALLRSVDPRDRPKLLEALRSSIAYLRPLEAEARIRRPGAKTRWIAIRGALVSASTAKPSQLSGVVYDITDQKENSTRTDALLREVSHRSKNLLALILAMARLTARDAVDVKSHLKDFALRVAGLSASQDLIVASDWKNVDLATLASAEINAVARTEAGRIAVSGPRILLTPEATQTLGMVLTELTLNAVENGALSEATGQVRLSWIFPDDATISITWRETGGPPSTIDGPKGYGRSVVERFSTQGLKLSANSSIEPDGFKWTLAGPIANIGNRAEGRA